MKKKIQILLFIFLLGFIAQSSVLAQSKNYVENQLLVHFKEAVFETKEEFSIFKENSSEDIKIINSSLAVLFEDGQLQTVSLLYDVNLALSGAKKSHSPKEYEIFSAHQESLKYMYLLSFDERADLEKIKSQLELHDLVKRVEFNKYLPSHEVPWDERLFEEQWAIPAINAFEAWDVYRHAGGIRVAVLDGGFIEDHRDFSHNDLTNIVAVDSAVQGLEDENGIRINRGEDPTSPFWQCNDHGTHVAGILGARGNNGIQMTGTFWSGEMVLIEMGDFVDRVKCWSLSASMVRAINLALTHGVRVINMSFSVGSSLVQQALLESPTILKVLSAGNDSINLDELDEEDNLYQDLSDTNHILIIANMDEEEEFNFSSNYGQNTVHLAAPGTNIYSLMAPRNGGGWKTGTSMAAPHVAGAATLAWSMCPDHITVPELHAAILSTARPLERWFQITQTDGVLDMNQLLRTLNRQECPQPDQDEDGIPDEEDNCIETSNPNQGDWDRNGIGDACQCAFENANALMPFQINLYREAREDLPELLMDFYQEHRLSFIQLLFKEKSLLFSFAKLLQEGQIYFKNRDLAFSQSFLKKMESFLQSLEESQFKNSSFLKMQYQNLIQFQTVNQFFKSFSKLHFQERKKNETTY